MSSVKTREVRVVSVDRDMRICRVSTAAKGPGDPPNPVVIELRQGSFNGPEKVLGEARINGDDLLAKLQTLLTHTAENVVRGEEPHAPYTAWTADSLTCMIRYDGPSLFVVQVRSDTGFLVSEQRYRNEDTALAAARRLRERAKR